jgi:glutamine amidotransferase
MSKREVVVIDYGVGNLLSVQRGLEHCGVDVVVSADPQVILNAQRVVLPGVGAFANAMAALHERGLVDVIRSVAARGTPLLGICLGMQLLLGESEEFGITAGLGIIPGRVVAIPATSTDGQSQKIPHIGWNELQPSENASWEGSVLQGVRPGEAVYFVHSFQANPNEPADRVADCIYGGHRIPAVIRHGQVSGCQFHPEKSGKTGLAILTNFCGN